MSELDPELRAIAEVAQQRLLSMGHAGVEVDAAAAAKVYARPSRLDGLRFGVELAGHPCLFSIWNIGTDKAAEDRADGILDAEVHSLRFRHRLVIHNVNSIGFKQRVVSMRCELVAAPGLDTDLVTTVEAEMRHMLDLFWDPVPVVDELVSRMKRYERSAAR